MKVAYIIYENYLSPDGNGMSVGGIQTYITNLIPIIQQNGYFVHLYQKANIDFEKNVNNTLITGVSHCSSKKDFVKRLKTIILSKIDKANDILLFGCDTLIFDSKGVRSIAIQHGIFWDKPLFSANTRYKYLRHFLSKMYSAWQTVNRVSKVRCLVCVDYNFVNWYRALTAYPLVKFHVIPNFTTIPSSIPSKDKSKIKIIFARRFFSYRGTRLFADAIKPILNDRDNIHVVIAGEGPDEKYLHDALDSYSQVSFIKYSSENSLSIHSDIQIAVVPTLGSEGTSLSLLEAMASGCAVICTNVGGMTNIVLGHYNGLIINPDSNELYGALSALIDNQNLRESISKRAYETASVSFSIKKWQDSWNQIIQNM